MSNSAFALVIFGIMFIMSLFVYIPFSDTVNLTDRGDFIEGTFEVTEDWEDSGVLLGDLETDGDIIYPVANQEGTWESNLIQGERFNIVRLETLSDVRDGNITYTINLWANDSSDEPDEVITGEIDEVDYFEEYDGLEQYDIIEVVLHLEETEGNSNKRPHVNELRLDYVENLDREGLGFDAEAFQLFTLFVLIGAGVLALTRGF